MLLHFVSGKEFTIPSLRDEPFTPPMLRECLAFLFARLICLFLFQIFREELQNVFRWPPTPLSKFTDEFLVGRILGRCEPFIVGKDRRKVTLVFGCFANTRIW